MKRATYVVVGLAMFSLGFYQRIEPPFQYTLLTADAVVIGMVVKVDADTFEFEVQEWLQARGGIIP